MSKVLSISLKCVAAALAARPLTAAAHVRPPLPDPDLHPDADCRRRRLRDLPVRRPGAGPDGDAARAIIRSRRKERPGLCRRCELDRHARTCRRPVALDPGRRATAVRSADGRRRPSTSIRPPIWSATAGMRRSTIGEAATARAAVRRKARRARSIDVPTIWAPQYRQAAYGAFLLKSEDAQQGARPRLSRRAGAPSTRSSPSSRASEPIILAGHSQGSLHLLRLLRRPEGRAEGPAGRGLCRRLAGQHHGRPAGDGPAGLHARRPGRLHAQSGRASRSPPTPS